MNDRVATAPKTVIHAIQYRDLAAALEWLCRAFGFEKHRVVDGAKGAVQYAEVSFGDSIIMLGSARDPKFDGILTHPDEIGGAETQTCYLIVEDADAQYAKARAAGADIVLDIGDDDDGGRVFTCRDLEGHIWNFGTYKPRYIPAGAMPAGWHSGATARGGYNKLILALGSLLFAVALAVTAGGVHYAAGQLTQIQTVKVVAKRAASEAREQVIQEQARRETAEREAKEAKALFDNRRTALAVAERAANEAREQVIQEQTRRKAAEREARAVQANLKRERAALAAAERAASEASEQVIQEQARREAAEREIREVQANLLRERTARRAAERAVTEAREQTIQEQDERHAAQRQTKETHTVLLPERRPVRAVPAQNVPIAADQNVKTPPSENPERTIVGTSPPFYTLDLGGF